jgi:hypothetical protein
LRHVGNGNIGLGYSLQDNEWSNHMTSVQRMEGKVPAGNEFRLISFGFAFHDR